MKEWNILADYCETHRCNLLLKEPLSKHTTFRIGGPCAAMVQVNSMEIVRNVLQFCKEQELPWVVIGNGSNILADDDGFDGVVLQLGKAFSAVVQKEQTLICCEAGASLATVGKFALEACLTGMEELSGIPGSIGGAVYMNAGAYGKEMKDVIASVTYFSPEDGEFHTLAKEQLAFSYRHSIFSGTKNVVVGVTLRLEPGKYADIQEKMQDYRKQRAAKQPLELPSAGSTFKRPVGSYASFLIDQCGLKGASVGDAQVSTKHAGFVVNTGHATCQDVLDLCAYVIETVKEKTGYCLELEPVFLQ